MKKAIIAVLLASCGSIYETDPVGVGYDANELKLSPCACIQVETLPGLPEWFASAIA
ncbi:MAG: hypothetical protein LBL52_01860 [Rickettsiales bacterium]|jgi:hypothetical protein|nr:hypothetical protein [Rickettsiales bacterium]